LTHDTEFSIKLPDYSLSNHGHEDFFSISDISFGSTDEDPIPTPDTEKESTAEQPEPPREIRESEDIWICAAIQPDKIPAYLSWDSFENPIHEQPQTPYLSEAGPEAFDAVLADERNILQLSSKNDFLVETSIYTISLLSLGLGRSSILFVWNEERHAFEQTVDTLRISGCTTDTVDGLVKTFLTCGNLTRRLQSFVDKTYTKNKSPGRIALADAISTLLTTLQCRLNVSAVSIQSILRLQALFKPAEYLLSNFHSIVTKVGSAKNDELMLSLMFEEIQHLEHTSDSGNEILLEVLARISRPFLDFLGEWIGIQKETTLPLEKGGVGRSFVKSDTRSWVDEQGMEMQEPDFILDETLVPSFLSEEDAHIMFQTGRNLRFLREYHSGHPLTRADVISSAKPPALEWKFSWNDIEGIQARATKFEKDLTAAINEFSSPSTQGPTKPKLPIEASPERHDFFEMQFLGKSEEEVSAHILASMDMFNQPFSSVGASDRLSDMLTTILMRDDEITEESNLFAPPISLTPLLSFSPIIAAQARVVNGTSVRLFFESHDLRENLSIQRRFHLLGDGVFSSRLSQALFDPDLETAERQPGVARSGGIMGLRLGGRDTWPPASSELRLALMGVLIETYNSSDAGGNHGGYLDRKKELPGDLSFSVRDMSEEDIQKCIDPDAIEALDFLRLSYKPPPPLDVIITPMCLYKYDQLFKLLLRVVRMLYITSQLFRDSTDRRSYWQGINPVAQRFRIEAHHFVTCVSSHFFDVGIDATWRIFDRKLDQIEKRINSEYGLTTLGQHEGLDKLREYHERVLDRIMFTLLLRKRQQPVMKLLEEIFSLILQFAKHSQSRVQGINKNIGEDGEVKEIYSRFKKKVEVFITVCRGLSEKKGYGEVKEGMSKGYGAGGLFDCGELAEENNTIVQLLCKLEMSGYYSR
jgi:hypothetical protein